VTVVAISDNQYQRCQEGDSALVIAWSVSPAKAGRGSRAREPDARAADLVVTTEAGRRQCRGGAWNRLTGHQRSGCREPVSTISRADGGYSTVVFQRTSWAAACRLRWRFSGAATVGRRPGWVATGAVSDKKGRRPPGAAASYPRQCSGSTSPLLLPITCSATHTGSPAPAS
jgi:hypothetical protein